MELNFSFKKTRTEEPEKYPDVAVLTYIGGEKTKKFKLNKKACEIMDYSESITSIINFGKTSDGDLFLANTYGKEENNKSNVFVDKSFANSKFLSRIEDHFGISLSEGAEFILATVDQDFGFPVVLVLNSDPSSRTTEDFSQFPDEDVDVESENVDAEVLDESKDWAHSEFEEENKF